MSKKYPECPHYDHNNCKHLYSPKVCAFSRDDNHCLREKPTKKKVPSELATVEKIAVAT